MDDEKLRTLWCGNLSSRVTDEILYELFLQAGPLERVQIPKDNNGQNRNFAFITFKHLCSIPYAKELLDGTCLYERPVLLQNTVSSLPDPRFKRGGQDYGWQDRGPAPLMNRQWQPPGNWTRNERVERPPRNWDRRRGPYDRNRR